MQADEIVFRLQEHSGLPIGKSQLCGKSLAELARAGRGGGTDITIESAVQDILACFESLNEHCRSSNTSEEMITRRLVYAVSGIQMLLNEWAFFLAKEEGTAHKLLLDVLIAAWKIGSAWDAVLAGDIDDVEQHITWEADAKDVKKP